ncbi:sugar fermentation stimulation protein [Enterococcus sp. 10A9_DIV0425]|uniref:Sugar fermentation stimulation protein homolog n=1 Tax=Candidatus Enterococcus wittei TaxID=1987383 RepID=A0A242JXX9_9ENTE|nr:DNA/RNA nuclease SfsA [Enterococcus sp. 10A9_DIV0425]OTP09553.1 sugar fermentation stimulation protein [Enterococcus sp. 10A9_DIV0425]THE15677.1 DNA/RNA nuclease SfsA [Enterococcus hirae]
MNYPQVEIAFFIDRPNRFIAHCLNQKGEVITTHVKNTGRGKEVFIPGAEVAVAYVPGTKRKTLYDLIAVKKKDQWINIDSQLPNKLAMEGILDGTIQLPTLRGEIVTYKREVTYRQSKFDIYIETSSNQKIFVEVKGMTLENNGVGAFPDAPTIRGLKHVKELVEAHQEGYETYLLFIAQFEHLQVATIHEEMHPDLAYGIHFAQQQGVEVLVYNCQVTKDQVNVKQSIPFDLTIPFEDPNL